MYEAGIEGARRGARVEATQLTRRFGEQLVLDGISLTIEPGETFALLGANGAGKTTFVRLVIGYLVPSYGRVTVDGFSPDKAPRAVHARLGYVAETSRLYPDLRVRGLLRFSGQVRGLGGHALDEAVERMIGRFDLTSVASRLVGNLSKGYQQRVSLAQAFVHDPPLLVVDEPTSGLDPLQQFEVREFLRSLAGQRTVILCTHDLLEARALATRAAVLRAGKLAALGSIDEVLDAAAPLDLFRAARVLPA
jgi:ABC-2 type transport system ATP-binding protein